jgi:hypothetical protein
VDVAHVPATVGDPGDADHPEHGGQPARVPCLAPGPNSAFRPDHDRAANGTNVFLLLCRAQVEVVLQQQPKQFPPGRFEVFLKLGVGPGTRLAA